MKHFGVFVSFIAITGKRLFKLETHDYANDPCNHSLAQQISVFLPTSLRHPGEIRENLMVNQGCVSFFVGILLRFQVLLTNRSNKQLSLIADHGSRKTGSQ